MPDNRETTVCLVEGEEFATVWTNVRSMKGRLTRLGLTPYETQAEGYWFKCPQEWFWPRRKRRVKGGQGPGRFPSKMRPTAGVLKQPEGSL